MKKNVCISVRCTMEQKQKIQERAEARKETVSEYVLDKTIHETKRKINKRRMEETEMGIRDLMTLVNKSDAGMDVKEEIMEEVKRLCSLYK